MITTNIGKHKKVTGSVNNYVLLPGIKKSIDIVKQYWKDQEDEEQTFDYYLLIQATSEIADGICVCCGSHRFVEPDAKQYTCYNCNYKSVYSVPSLMRWL